MHGKPVSRTLQLVLLFLLVNFLLYRTAASCAFLAGQEKSHAAPAGEPEYDDVISHSHSDTGASAPPSCVFSMLPWLTLYTVLHKPLCLPDIYRLPQPHLRV